MAGTGKVHPIACPDAKPHGQEHVHANFNIMISEYLEIPPDNVRYLEVLPIGVLEYFRLFIVKVPELSKLQFPEYLHENSNS